MTAWVCWERRSYQYFRLVWPPELVLDDLDGLGFIECVYGILQTACTASVCPCTSKTLSPSNQIRAGTGGTAHRVQIPFTTLNLLFQRFSASVQRLDGGKAAPGRQGIRSLL